MDQSLKNLSLPKRPQGSKMPGRGAQRYKFFNKQDEVLGYKPSNKDNSFTTEGGVTDLENSNECGQQKMNSRGPPNQGKIITKIKKKITSNVNDECQAKQKT
ncbi:hypothetical protein QE152_g24946 [Popillia japonica]|uniref:Uncharacterized protein n=1 Tax=Popillia japonica TaxID=7064 RepID=A0AAW1K3J8_POPJA